MELSELRDKCTGSELETLMDKACKMSWANFGKKIELYYTYYQDRSAKTQFTSDAKERFKENFINEMKSGLNVPTPIMNLSGLRCELKCEHCKRINLLAMYNADTPEKLYDAARSAHAQGSKALLLSGGSNKDGTTIIGPGFDNTIEKIKKEFGVYIGIHAGYVSKERVRAIKKLGVDSILVDVIGDPDTFRNVYHIDRPLSVVEDVIRYSVEEDIDVIPHICIGLDFCNIKGEFDAIDMLSRYPIKFITFIILEPTPGTPMAELSPPPVEDVARVMVYGRFKLPDTLHTLGCIRPLGSYGERMELLAVRTGCNRIAGISSDLTIQECRELDIEYNIATYCCMAGNGMFDHLYD